MRKKLSFGKIIGVVLCMLSVVILIGILILSSDTRGYKKLLDNYYSSVQRNSQNDLNKTISAEDSINISDIRRTLITEDEDLNDDYFKGNIIKYKINKLTKEKIEQDNVLKAYNIELEVILNVNSGNHKSVQNLIVGKINGKWKVIV